MDGGGIKGLFPATVLAELERRHLGGRSIASYFDLVAGTSTGGMLALGLGAGLSATALAEIYTQRGAVVFPEFDGLADRPDARLVADQATLLPLPL